MASIQSYALPHAIEFLAQIRSAFQSHEAAHSLILGLVERLVKHPERVARPPYMAAVTENERLALAALITPPYRILLDCSSQPGEAALDCLAQDLEAGGWDPPGVQGPLETAQVFAHIWSHHRGQSYYLSRNERLFELTRVYPIQPAPGSFRQATAEDIPLLTEWVQAFWQEIGEGGGPTETRSLVETRTGDGDYFLWEDAGDPVSMAARTRPVSHGISIGQVYTPIELRGRGYASNCVATLSQYLLDSGYQYCALFANQSNRTSNHIYQTIGFRPVADFTVYTFDRPEISATRPGD